MLLVGITQSEPKGLPQVPFPDPQKPFPNPKPLPHLPKSPSPQQALPTGQAGGRPMLVSRRIQLQSMLIRTPVKPHPDTPPLSVKTVTVQPIYRHKSSLQWQSFSTTGNLPICISHLSFGFCLSLGHSSLIVY